MLLEFTSFPVLKKREWAQTSLYMLRRPVEVWVIKIFYLDKASITMELRRSPESLYVMLSISYGHPFSADFCIETNRSCKILLKIL